MSRKHQKKKKKRINEVKNPVQCLAQSQISIDAGFKDLRIKPKVYPHRFP